MQVLNKLDMEGNRKRGSDPVNSTEDRTLLFGAGQNIRSDLLFQLA